MGKRPLIDKPRCAYCDRRYGMPNYEDHRAYTPVGGKFEPPKGVYGKVTAYRTDRDQIVHAYKTWDGKKLIGTHHRPFCSLKCALAFARAAYDEGRRYKLFSLETET